MENTETLHSWPLNNTGVSSTNPSNSQKSNYNLKKKTFFNVEVQFINNVVLDSGVLQSDSVTCTFITLTPIKLNY